MLLNPGVQPVEAPSRSPFFWMMSSCWCGALQPSSTHPSLLRRLVQSPPQRRCFPLPTRQPANLNRNSALRLGQGILLVQPRCIRLLFGRASALTLAIPPPSSVAAEASSRIRP